MSTIYIIINYFSGYVFVTYDNTWDSNIFTHPKLILCPTDYKTTSVLSHIWIFHSPLYLHPRDMYNHRILLILKILKKNSQKTKALLWEVKLCGFLSFYKCLDMNGEGPFPLLLNDWLLMDSKEWGAIVFSWVLTAELMRLHWIASSPWSYKQAHLNLVQSQNKTNREES